MTAIQNAVDTDTHNVTQVTIAPGRVHHVHSGAFTYAFKEGDALYVPTFEVQYLRRDGVIV